MNRIEKLHGDFVEITINDESHAQYLPVKRDSLISVYIRKKYTLDDEIATLANANDSEKHAAEYAAYQAYRTSVKSGISEIWDEVERMNQEWEDAQPKMEMNGNSVNE